jgi:hypothetical protein
MENKGKSLDLSVEFLDLTNRVIFNNEIYALIYRYDFNCKFSSNGIDYVFKEDIKEEKFIELTEEFKQELDNWLKQYNIKFSLGEIKSDIVKMENRSMKFKIMNTDNIDNDILDSFLRYIYDLGLIVYEERNFLAEDSDIHTISEDIRPNKIIINDDIRNSISNWMKTNFEEFHLGEIKIEYYIKRYD